MKFRRILPFTLILVITATSIWGMKVDPAYTEYLYFRHNTPASSKAITVKDLLKCYKLEVKDNEASLRGVVYDYYEETIPDGMILIYFSTKPLERDVGLQIREYNGLVLDVQCQYIKESSDSMKTKTLYSNKSSWKGYFEKRNEFFASKSKKYPFLPPLKVSLKYQLEFYKLLRKDRFSVYGFFCDEPGIAPGGRMEIMRLLDHKEYTAIRYVLFSENPVCRVYATEALILLKNKGLKLSDKEDDVIQGMMTSDEEIEVCNGCARSVKKIKDVLKESGGLDLKELLDHYGTLGYLK